MVGEYPDEIAELEDDELEDNAEKQNEIYEDLAPSSQIRNDLYSLFKWVIRKPDSSKTGNLDKEELGMLDISVRDCQKIAQLADELGHPAFGDYFRMQAEIVLRTSNSKNGWLPELFVSEKKARSKETKRIPPPQPLKKKRRFF